MEVVRVELVYFEGCPNVQGARDNIRTALEECGIDSKWDEWDLMSESTPAAYRRHPSPTVLVDGQDVTGEEQGASAVSCRAGGAPPATAIAARLQPGGSTPE